MDYWLQRAGPPLRDSGETPTGRVAITQYRSVLQVTIIDPTCSQSSLSTFYIHDQPPLVNLRDGRDRCTASPAENSYLSFRFGRAATWKTRALVICLGEREGERETWRRTVQQHLTFVHTFLASLPPMQNAEHEHWFFHPRQLLTMLLLALEPFQTTRITESGKQVVQPRLLTTCQTQIGAWASHTFCEPILGRPRFRVTR